MPKTTRRGAPKQSELPRPLQNSSEEAQPTYARARAAGVKDRSSMSKEELADALARKGG